MNIAGPLPQGSRNNDIDEIDDRRFVGHYLDIVPDRTALARYGLSVGDLQEVVSTALGGEMVTTTVEGLERYGVIVRYPRELRADPQAIATQILVPVMGGGASASATMGSVVPMAMGATTSGKSAAGTGGAMVPLGQVAKISRSRSVSKHCLNSPVKSRMSARRESRLLRAILQKA